MIETEGVVGKILSGSGGPARHGSAIQGPPMVVHGDPIGQFGLCMLSLIVVVSCALTTYAREESAEESTETAPGPTVIVLVCAKAIVSITLTRLPLQFGK